MNFVVNVWYCNIDSKIPYTAVYWCDPLLLFDTNRLWLPIYAAIPQQRNQPEKRRVRHHMRLSLFAPQRQSCDARARTRTHAHTSLQIAWMSCLWLRHVETIHVSSSYRMDRQTMRQVSVFQSALQSSTLHNVCTKPHHYLEECFLQLLAMETNFIESDDSVNSGRCYVTPATYTQATTEQRGYATRTFPWKWTFAQQ
jgi:hypothetical protein